MGIDAINSINPYKKPYGVNQSIFGGANYQPSVSIFGQNQNNNNNNNSRVDFGTSIFNTNINVPKNTGLNPFASVNSNSKIGAVSPVNAKQNYMNGLAPADNLQNVYAGKLNGKVNILNQIAIA